jgi:hypothetical protein
VLPHPGPPGQSVTEPAPGPTVAATPPRDPPVALQRACFLATSCAVGWLAQWNGRPMSEPKAPSGMSEPARRTPPLRSATTRPQFDGMVRGMRCAPGLNGETHSSKDGAQSSREIARSFTAAECGRPTRSYAAAAHRADQNPSLGPRARRRRVCTLCAPAPSQRHAASEAGNAPARLGLALPLVDSVAPRWA